MPSLSVGAHPRPQAQARAALTVALVQASSSPGPLGTRFRLLICVGIPTQRLGRTAYVLLLKNMATAMNATVRGRQKQYILQLRKQIILKLS